MPHMRKIRSFLSRLKAFTFDRKVNLASDPVFIVGCGHSGTTLMLSIIARHPSFYAVPFESNVFFPSKSMREIKEFFSTQEELAGGKRILEKTPRHVRSIHRILRIFPNAQIIAMVRDGRDVACSMIRRDIKLKKGIRRWVRDCTRIARWKKDSRVHVVKYEDLVANEADIVAGIFKFLDEEAHLDKVLETSETMEWQFSPALDLENLNEEEQALRKKHNKRRNEQINKPIYNDTEKWRNELNEEQITFLSDIAGPTLEKWGYK